MPTEVKFLESYSIGFSFEEFLSGKCFPSFKKVDSFSELYCQKSLFSLNFKKVEDFFKKFFSSIIGEFPDIHRALLSVSSIYGNFTTKGFPQPTHCLLIGSTNSNHKEMVRESAPLVLLKSNQDRAFTIKKSCSISKCFIVHNLIVSLTKRDVKKEIR